MAAIHSFAFPGTGAAWYFKKMGVGVKIDPGFQKARVCSEDLLIKGVR